MHTGSLLAQIVFNDAACKSDTPALNTLNPFIHDVTRIEALAPLWNAVEQNLSRPCPQLPSPPPTYLSNEMTSALLGKAGKKLFEKHLEQYAPADPKYEFYVDEHGKQKRRKVCIMDM